MFCEVVVEKEFSGFFSQTRMNSISFLHTDLSTRDFNHQTMSMVLKISTVLENQSAIFLFLTIIPSIRRIKLNCCFLQKHPQLQFHLIYRAVSVVLIPGVREKVSEATFREFFFWKPKSKSYEYSCLEFKNCI